MAESWEQRLAQWLDPDQVRRGDAAIVAAIDSLPDKLAPGAGHTSSPTAGAERAGIAGQWVVGYGATPQSIPLIARTNHQPVALSTATRGSLAGATVTFQTGALEGQSFQVQAVSDVGILTPDRPLTAAPAAGDYIYVSAAPNMLLSVYGPWLQTRVDVGHPLSVTSPWGGTVSLTTLSEPIEVTVGAGFTGTVTGSVTGPLSLRVGQGVSTAINFDGTAVEDMALTLGNNAAGVIHVGAAGNTVKAVTVTIGDDYSATASLGVIESLEHGVVELGAAAYGSVTAGFLTGKLSLGDAMNGTVYATGGQIFLELGASFNGILETSNASGCVFVVGPGMSGALRGYGANLGALVHEGFSGTLVFDGGAKQVMATIGRNASVSTTLSSVDTATLRFGDGAANGYTAVAAASGTGTATLGLNSLWPYWGQSLVVAAGATVTSDWFDLSGWTVAMPAATVSGGGPWTLTMQAGRADGSGPAAAVSSASAAAGVIEAGGAAVTGVPAGRLLLANTGTASVNLVNLGWLLHS